MEQQLQRATPSERLAARLNRTDGVRRHGPAFAVFAEAVGHLNVLRDPELFTRSLIGSWPRMELFVRDFVIESGLQEQVEQLPERLRPYIGIDADKTAQRLREELLVLDVEDRVYVFDAQPVVKTTVEVTEQVAHTGEHVSGVSTP